MTARKKLTQAAVKYRLGTSAKHCGNCVMYHPAADNQAIGSCDLVLGTIHREAVCNKWERR